MGELIFCRKPIAANPYYIDEVSLNIYSLEEMSYFIYHNPYLINSSFMNMELCNWIQREQNEPELARQLKELISQSAPLSLFIGKLLGSNGYLSLNEIKKTMDVISSFENKSEAECRKLRADRLMEKNKLIDAVYEYETIIEQPHELSPEVLGDTYHNLGTAYARLFFFDQATACYEQAFINNKRRSSLKSMFYAIRCTRDEEKYRQMVMKYRIPEEIAQRLKEDVSRVSTSDEVRQYQDRINSLRSDYGSEEAYLAQLDRQLDEWIEAYGYMSRI